MELVCALLPTLLGKQQNLTEESEVGAEYLVIKVGKWREVKEVKHLLYRLS